MDGGEQEQTFRLGPLSPQEIKPDISILNENNPRAFSPKSASPVSFAAIGLHTMNMANAAAASAAAIAGHNTNAMQQGQQQPQQYPPNHPLSGSNHLCSICGYTASGKHYGVYSCEGCMRFFKRTVRKDLTYTCREDRNCIIDKRQRNRCQYCRYHKCLACGMKREAVENARSTDDFNPTSTVRDLTIERIIEAEQKSEQLSVNNQARRKRACKACTTRRRKIKRPTT